MEFATRADFFRRHDDPVPKSGVLEGVTGEEAARSIPRSPSCRSPPACAMHAAWPEVQVIWDFFLRGETHRKKWNERFVKPMKKLSFTITPNLPVDIPHNAE